MASSLDFIREFTSRAGEMLGDMEVFDYVTGERTLLNPALNPDADPAAENAEIQQGVTSADAETLNGAAPNAPEATQTAPTSTTEDSDISAIDTAAGLDGAEIAPEVTMQPDDFGASILESAAESLMVRNGAEPSEVEAAQNQEFSANATSQEELMRREIASENSLSGESDRKRRELEQQRARRMADGMRALEAELQRLQYELDDINRQIELTEEELARLREALAENEQEIADNAELEERMEVAAQIEQDLAAAIAEAEEIANDIDTALTELEDLDGATDDIGNFARRAESAANEARARLESAEEEFTEASENLANLEERLGVTIDPETGFYTGANISEAEAEDLYRLRGAVEEAGANLMTRREEFDRAQQTANDMAGSMDEHAANIERNQNIIDRLSPQLEAAQENIAVLQERLDSEMESIMEDPEMASIINEITQNGTIEMSASEILSAVRERGIELQADKLEILQNISVAEERVASLQERADMIQGRIEAAENNLSALNESAPTTDGWENYLSSFASMFTNIDEDLGYLADINAGFDTISESIGLHTARLEQVATASDALNESMANNFQEMQIGSITYSTAVRNEYEIRQQIAQEITGASPEELEMSAFIYVDPDDPMGRMRMGNAYLTPNQQGRLQDAIDATAEAREQWVNSMDAFEDDQETLEALQNERALLQTRIDELSAEQDELMAEMEADPDNAYMASLNRAQNERMIAEAEAQIEAIDESLQISADFVAFLDDGNNLERIDNIVRQYTDPNSVSEIVSSRDFFENTVPENLQSYLREEMPEFFGEDALSLADYMEANPSTMQDFGELQSEIMTLAGMVQAGEAEPGHINQAVEAFLAENPQIPQEHRDFIENTMINDQLQEATTLRPTAPEPEPEPEFVAGAISTPIETELTAADATLSVASHSSADGNGIQSGIQTSADFRAAVLGETSQPMQSTPAPGFAPDLENQQSTISSGPGFGTS